MKLNKLIIYVLTNFIILSLICNSVFALEASTNEDSQNRSYWQHFKCSWYYSSQCLLNGAKNKYRFI